MRVLSTSIGWSMMSSWLSALLGALIVKGKRSLGGVSLGVFEGYILSLDSSHSFSLLPRGHELSSLAPPWPPSMMLCIITKSDTMESADYGLKPLKPWAKNKPFLLLVDFLRYFVTATESWLAQQEHGSWMLSHSCDANHKSPYLVSPSSVDCMPDWMKAAAAMGSVSTDHHLELTWSTACLCVEEFFPSIVSIEKVPPKVRCVFSHSKESRVRSYPRISYSSVTTFSLSFLPL
jgi:hypothetical protein